MVPNFKNSASKKLWLYGFAVLLGTKLANVTTFLIYTKRHSIPLTTIKESEFTIAY